jgi:hypothetical protein
MVILLVLRFFIFLINYFFFILNIINMPLIIKANYNSGISKKFRGTFDLVN